LTADLSSDTIIRISAEEEIFNASNPSAQLVRPAQPGD
jgi:hypothetical protein